MTAPGSRYCGSFGGEDVKNTPDLFKRKDAPAPGSCPSVPGRAGMRRHFHAGGRAV